MIVHLANEFVNKGAHVELILAHKEGEYFQEVRKEVRIIDFAKSRVLWTLLPFARYLRKNRPDVLISTLDHANIIAVFANLLAAKPTKVIVRIANTLSVSLQGTRLHKRLLRRYGAALFYRFADRIVTNSNGSADDLAHTLHLDRSQIRVIYNPTVTPNIERKSEEPVVHPWLQDKTFPVVLAVGRLHVQKDYPTLLRAIALINEKQPVRLIVLGEELGGGITEKEKLAALARDLSIADMVDFHGFATNPYAYMAKADVYVLSSRWEGLPNTLIEAMAVGTPVVSTDCPSGPSEILEDGKYGTLVPVGDYEALAQAIQDTVQNPISSEELQRRAQLFSSEKATEHYLHLIESITKHD